MLLLSTSLLITFYSLRKNTSKTEFSLIESARVSNEVLS